MKHRSCFIKLIAMTMAAVMLPWSSFIYGGNVEAASINHSNTINKNISSLPESIDISDVDLVVDSDYTLSEDMTVDSLLIMGSYIDLNGYTLTVNEFVVADEGGVSFNGGNLVIGGDLYISGEAPFVDYGPTGALELYGNLLVSKESYMNFGYDDDDFIFRFCGNELQSIEIYDIDDDNYGFTFSKLDISEAYEVECSYDVYVTDEIISDLDSTYDGTLYFTRDKEKKLTGEGFVGNLYMYDHTFENDYVIDGNVNLYGTITNYGNLTVTGDVYNGGVINNYGSLDVSGDLAEDREELFRSNINSYDGSKITVGGNIKADCIDMKQNSSLSLNGSSKQTIDISQNSRIYLLDLNNPSNDGVYFSYPYDISNIKKNGTKIDINGFYSDMPCQFTGNHINGKSTLLSEGTYDLERFSYRISGDLILAGADIDIDRGSLIVSGNIITYNIIDDDPEKVFNSIYMNDDKGSVHVDGDISLNQKDISGLKKGTIYASGNVFRNVSYDPDDPDDDKDENIGTKIVLCGNSDQSISGINSLDSLEISNESNVGIGNIKINKSIKSNSKDISGEISIDDFSVLGSDIYGDIVFCGDTELTEDISLKKKLIVEGTLDLNLHTLEVPELVLRNGGRLIMDSPDDCIVVKDKMVIEDSGDTLIEPSHLTDGRIVLYGDFECRDTQAFVCEGDHEIVLESSLLDDYSVRVHNISFTEASDHKSRFNVLRVKGGEEVVSFGNDPDTVANEIIYEINYAGSFNPPIIVDTDSTYNTVTLNYTDDNTDPEVSAYVIYRDGVKTATVSTRSYVDKNLIPDTDYIYTIYCMDQYQNLSTPSEEITVRTKTDTEPPSVPSDINITSVSGSSITIGWDKSSDNVGVTGYNVYRDNVKIAEAITDTSFKDTGLLKDTVYKYTITALDAAGNESEMSEMIAATVSMPEIIDVSPSDDSKIGGEQVTLGATYKRFDMSGYTLDIYAFDINTGDWKKLNDTEIKPETINFSNIESKFTWNIKDYSSGVIDVKYVLTDTDGVTDERIVTYEIDNTAPLLPKNLKAIDKDGDIELSWDASEEIDAAGYRVYRCILPDDFSGAEEAGKLTYVKVADIPSVYTTDHLDREVSEGSTVRYIVTAYDSFNNESELKDFVQVTVSKDISVPEIRSISPDAVKVGGNVELDVIAVDNKAVNIISIYYREADNNALDWIYLGEAVNDGSYKSSNLSISESRFTYDWDTSVLPDGAYQIKAVAEDASGNSSEYLDGSGKLIGEFTRRYEIDNTPPGKVINVTGNVGSTYAQLMWDDMEDVSEFIVSEIKNGSAHEIGRVSERLGFTIDELKPDTDYTFVVNAIDAYGNKGEYSDEIKVRTTSDTQSPVITEVLPVQGRVKDSINISMSVRDNNAVSRGVISESLDVENFEVIYDSDEDDKSSSKFSKERSFFYNLDITDTEKYPEGYIYIRYEAYDTAGNKNAVSGSGAEIETKYLIDRTAPDTPSGFKAVSKDGYIELSWDEPEESLDEEQNNSINLKDVAEYKVIRTDIATGKRNTYNAGSSINYYDTDIEPGNYYSYKVKAVDAVGNESNTTDEIYVTAIPDTTAPEIRGISPKDGSVIGKKPEFTVLATDNASLKTIKAFYRSKDTTGWALFSENDELKDRSVMISLSSGLEDKDEGDYEFRFIAIDKYGNEGSYEYRTYTLDKTPPEGSVIAEEGNLCINLTLSHDSDITKGEAAPGISAITDILTGSDFNYYEIYRCKLVDAPTDLKFYNNAECIYKTVSNEYCDKDVESNTAYRYAAKVYDKAGNFSWTKIVEGVAKNADVEAPIINVETVKTAAAGKPVQFDAGGCSDNVKITEYKWIIDGDTKNPVYGVRPEVSFTSSGKHKVELIIKDAAGNTSEADISVTVMDLINAGIVDVVVTDMNGTPIPYAYVFVQKGSDADKTMMTDGAGHLLLVYPSGSYTIAAFKDGYLPEETTIKVEKMGIAECQIPLSSGELIKGELTMERMSIQEIVDSGVDLSDPANLNTYTFKTTMFFEKTPVPVVIEDIPGREGMIDNIDDVKPGGGDSENQSYYKPDPGGVGISASYIEVPVAGSADPIPVLAILTTTQSISWLKTMYSASLTVMNMAKSQYVIEGSEAEVSLPDGVSLAALSTGKQEKKVSLGNIAGQEQRSVSWILKGDKSGKYDIDASFSGILTPFNVPVSKTFKASTEMSVEDTDIWITVMPEKSLYLDESYYVHFAITNAGKEPLYNFKTSIGDYRLPADKDYVYLLDKNNEEIEESIITGGGLNLRLPVNDQLVSIPVLNGSDSITIPTLMPGQTLYGTWKIGETDAGGSGIENMGYGFEGNPERDYYKLVDTLVEVIEGENLGVTVQVAPIPSHATKVIRGVARGEDIVVKSGDPVDMTSGAFTDSIDIISLQGKNTLKYSLSYDSITAGMKCGDTDLSHITNPYGTGWTGDFSSFIKEESGLLKYYINPYCYIAYISKDAYEGKIHGTVETDPASATDAEEIDTKTNDTSDKTINLTAGETVGDIEYAPVTHGMEGCSLVRHEDGTYTLTSAAGQSFDYDESGRLVKIIMEDGSVTTLTHEDNTTIIRDEFSGNTIILTYNEDGKLSSVSDGGDRITKLYYTGDDLTMLEDALGQKTEFVYDIDHHITAEKNDSGETFISNEYDTEGRVTLQTDSYGKQLEFTYEDQENGNLSISATTISDGYDDVTKTVVSDINERVLKTTDESGNTEVYSYDEDGNLVSRVNAYGNETRFSYDEKGRLVSSEGLPEETYEIFYDDNGNVTSVSGMANGTSDVSTYTYDDNNNLASADVFGAVTTYSYDTDNVVTSETREGKGTKQYKTDKGRLTASIDELGKETKYNYDTAGNLTKITGPMGNSISCTYNALNQKISETDALGNTTYYTYDDYNNVTSITDALGNKTEFIYDTAGSLIKTVRPDGTEIKHIYDMSGNVIKDIYPDGSEVSYTYSATGDLLKITYPDDSTEEFTYDSCHNLISAKDQKGNVTTYSVNKALEQTDKVTDCYGNTISYSFNSDNRLEKSVSSLGGRDEYTYDTAGRVTSITDALGNKTEYIYNVWGELVSEIDSKGNKTEYLYDAAGNCIEKKLPTGLTLRYTYDDNYNLISVETEVTNNSQTKASNDNKLKIKESYTYDAMGNVLTYKDAMGRVTRYSYDALNRLKEEKGPDGISIKYTYDSIGNVIKIEKSTGETAEFKYDVMGRVIEATSTGADISKKNNSNNRSNAKTYDYSYDIMGRTTSITDPMDLVTENTYDALGNVTSVKDAMGGITEYTYDNTSKLLSETNAIGSRISYNYDESGILISQVNARGQKTEYTYDEFKRLISLKDEAGEISYTYDKDSNLIKVTDETGSIERTYDKYGRVESVTDCNGRTVGYSYDEIGNLVDLTYPGGEIVRYEYNPDLSLKAVIDSKGRRTAYTYDKAGRLIKTEKPDGSVDSVTYNNRGLVETEIETGPDGKVLTSYTYTYDGFGNIISIKDNVTDEGDVDYLKEAGTVGRDDEVEESSETTETKEKITTTTNKVTTATSTMEYDSANRLVKYNGKEVLYDEDGNMTYGPLDGKMTELKYDCRNRLIQAGDVSYTYDAENVRIKAETSEYIEEYVTDREASLPRTLQIIRKKADSTNRSDTDSNKNNNTDNSNIKTAEETTNYYYGVALIYEVSASDKNDDSLRIYHYDHLGSTRKITDREGKVLYSFIYGTYGELLSIRDVQNSKDNSDDTSISFINEKHPIRFLYNGALGVITDDNGLYYMRQRYYNSDIKRFINQDVLTGDISNSQSLNRYAYVQGNPVNYNDPFGLSPRQILAPYAAVAHDILNILSIIPGPVGCISGMLNATIYMIQGDAKMATRCMLQAALTGIALPGGGLVVGTLCSYSRAAQAVVGVATMGAGMYTAATSLYEFYKNLNALSEEIYKQDKDWGKIFHYFSNTVNSGAGVIYGANAVYGGATVLNAQCFVAGTIVKTEDGDKNIEDIKPGDKVYSCNTDTGETGLKEVKKVFINEIDELQHLTVSKTEEQADTNSIEKEITIDCTPGHRFYVVDYGFKRAEDLKVGDKVKLFDGSIYEVTSNKYEKLEEPVKVYNFEVEDWHTYYVSDRGILVHNQTNSCGVTTESTNTEDSRLKTEATETSYGKSSENVAKGGRKTGTYGELTAEGYKDAHHIIQDAAVRDIDGYDMMEAPAIQLAGPSNKIGTEHYYATSVQRLKGGGTYGQERGIAYMALRKAGISKNDAKAYVRTADEYFMDKLGLSLDSPTRIPGNRRRR